MNLICEKTKCFGCTACQNICPKQAITMQEDERGFKYPKIQEDKCIDCGLCKKVCPYYDVEKIKNNKTIAIAVKNKNEDIRIKSTSGGVFSEIAEYAIKNNGIVYAATFNEELEVIHKELTNIEDIPKFRGSKYVQSNVEGVVEKIEEDQEKYKKVIFIGTPCQVAGVKKYLESKRKLENVILIDLICHGVPSPKVWREHIKILNRKGEVKNFYFRTKIKGWHRNKQKVEYNTGRNDYKSPLSQAYNELYFTEKISRKSCYQCPFTDIRRVSDITIGDFWGVERKYPEFDDNKGVSLILINTEKGEKIINDIKNKLIIKEVKNEHVMQPQLKYPVKEPENNDKFWKEYEEKGHLYILKKYTNMNIKKRIINNTKILIMKITPRKVKDIIKNKLNN